MSFSAGRHRRACVVFNRSRVDFAAPDLAVAGVLRPRLAAAMTRVAPTPAKALLTARETEILELVSRGHSNRQIAHRLGISPRTVDKHLEHAYTKLDVHGVGRVTVAAQWRTTG